MKTDDIKRAYGIDRLDETLAAIFEVLFVLLRKNS